MPNYGNTRVAGRSIFSTRKVRSNKGVKRGPRVAPMIGSNNVILVNNSGVGHVGKTRKRTYGPRKPRSNKGVRRTVGPVLVANNMGLAKLFRERKPRSNKGTKRGPRYFPRNTNLFM